MKSNEEELISLKELAKKQLESYEFEEAYQTYGRIIEIDPENALAYLMCAKLRETLGDKHGAAKYHKNAKRILNTYIKDNPDNVSNYIRRGASYQDTGDFEHAIDDYSQALLLDPTNLFALYNRATCYKMTKECDKAIDDLSKVIKIEPDHVDAIIERGNLYLSKGGISDDLALKDFNKVIELAPYRISGWQGRALIYINNKEDDLATRDLLTALELKHIPKNSYKNLLKLTISHCKTQYQKYKLLGDTTKILEYLKIISDLEKRG